MTVKKSKRVMVKLPVKKAKQSKRPKRARRPLHGMLKTVGGMVGGYFGGPAGADIGSTAGKLISRITGFGDYKISRNSISMGQSVPSFRGSNNGVRMCHSEFLTNITGSVNFSSQTFPINPGLLKTFPWLCRVAANYEQYEMHGLVFMYKPSSGMAISSTSAALGVVVQATNYDAIDAPFTNKQQMESYEFAVSSAPFSECIHPIECARRANVLDDLYLRQLDSVPTGTDIRMYDMGNYQIATEGMQSVYTIGELWVSYDVSFKKPRIPIMPSAVSFARFYSSPDNTAADAAVGGSGGFVLSPGSFLPGVAPSGNGITLSQPGYYFVAVCTKGVAGSNISVIQEVMGSNFSMVNTALFNKRTSYVSAGVGTSSQSSISMYLLNVANYGTGLTNKITWTTPSGGMTSGNTDVFVFPFLPGPLTLSDALGYLQIHEESESKMRF